VTYAIIEVGGKQYRVREGERLLVDRLREDEGATFSPSVLLVGGDGATELQPAAGTVTAKVLGPVKGPKIRIGKYRKRTGYRRHTGFRASLTQIEIESIGGKRARAAAKPKAASAKAEKAAETTGVAAALPAALPSGYDAMTVAEIKQGAGSWGVEALEAALAYEREHGARKGAISALGAAIGRKEDEE
jgi:large subunit ribosomal protein L21